MIIKKSSLKVFLILLVIVFPSFQGSFLFSIKFLLALLVFALYARTKLDLLIFGGLMLLHGLLHEIKLGDLKSIKFSLVVFLFFLPLYFRDDEKKLISHLILLSFVLTFLVWLNAPLYYLLYGNETLTSVGYFTGPFVNHIEAGLACFAIIYTERLFIFQLFAFLCALVIRSKFFIILSSLLMLIRRRFSSAIFLVLGFAFCYDYLFFYFGDYLANIFSLSTSASVNNRLDDYEEFGNLLLSLYLPEILFGIGVQDILSISYSEVEIIRLFHSYGLLFFVYFLRMFFVYRGRLPMVLPLFLFFVNLLPSPVSVLLIMLMFRTRGSD